MNQENQKYYVEVIYVTRGIVEVEAPSSEEAKRYVEKSLVIIPLKIDPAITSHTLDSTKTDFDFPSHYKTLTIVPRKGYGFQSILDFGDPESF